jgi:hypothetical protein
MKHNKITEMEIEEIKKELQANHKEKTPRIKGRRRARTPRYHKG